jgi:hypothetical protein
VRGRIELHERRKLGLEQPMAGRAYTQDTGERRTETDNRPEARTWVERERQERERLREGFTRSSERASRTTDTTADMTDAQRRAREQERGREGPSRR